MKFWEIFRFEFTYQMRRPWPWLCILALAIFAFVSTRVAIVPVTLPQDFILNSPFIITAVTVFSSQIWLLIAPAVAGEAAARDVHIGLYPLTSSSPISKAEFLGGRFFAAFVINALILLAVQVGSLLAIYAPGANPEIIGPFRPAAYLSAFGYIALTNALIATTVQFSAALISGRPIASYVGSMALFFLSYPVTFTLYLSGLGQPALLADPIGVMAIMNEMMSNWTIVEKNIRLFTLEGQMLMNRLLWCGIAFLVLAIIYLRFRFAHRTASDIWSRLMRLFAGETGMPDAPILQASIVIPQVPRSFGFKTQVLQTFSIALSSFRMIARTPAGLFLLVGFPMFIVLVLLQDSEHWGIPLIPRTGYILSKHLTASLTQFTDFRVIIPLLIIYFTGELVWRERDARISENIDTTPVPEWVLFLGKFLGLGLVLCVYMVSITGAGMLGQTIMGYQDYRIGQYLQILFGLQLPEYLLFAVLAFAVHAVVNQKHVAMLLSLVVYFLIVFSSMIGIHHKLLIYGASPEWSFTDIRGYSDTLGPWLWFKLYWTAWALLLAVVIRLLWVRGRESGFGTRLQIMRQRFTPSTIGMATLAAVLILALGSFIFYNTNVLNEYITDDEMVQRRADYELQYGHFEGIPQPQRTATKLHIDIHPHQRTATIRGSYRLVNRHQTAIDSIHLEPAFYVMTSMKFDRVAREVLSDEKLGHFIYALDEPLQPGDSLTLNFDVQLAPNGFRNTGLRSSGAGIAVLENGTYLTDGALPVIGYHPLRELWSSTDRRKYGLPRQVTLVAPGDIDPHVAAEAAGTFEAVVSTDLDQVGVAPGELQRTWSEGGRRYFHYVSDVPINGMEVFFSARYLVHRERWKHVDIQVYVHPGHREHLERVLRSVRASLEYYSEQFGTYPYKFLQIVEQPGNFLGMGVDGSGVITGGEGFFLFDPKGDGFDAMFEVVAHEMGHQWWGMQLKPAFAEGGGVISESLAWYSAMRLVKKVKGPEALRQFTNLMREPDPWPPIRTGLPLLRAMDPWANYRKGPYAMHALSEYVGEARVNAALRSLIEKKASTLATTLDMYRELQTVTPDSLKYLLHDLFETNTFWELATVQATAKQASGSSWEVTLDVQARKVVSDTAGVDTELPMNEWVEIGVYPPREGNKLYEPLYLEQHRIRSGRQTITVTVPRKPAWAGIDPRLLLIDLEAEDNTKEL